MKTLLHRRQIRGGKAGTGHPPGRPEGFPAIEPDRPELDTNDASRGRLRDDLRASVVDGASFSVMVGIGETYLPAFVLALGMGEIAAGLIVSLPLLLGAFLQLISPRAVTRLKSNRRWVVICVLLQAGSFIPMIIAAACGGAPPVVIYLAAALYWGAGLGAGPAWNTWMESIVPRYVRAPFFAWRSRLSQAGVLVGFVVGGFSLQYGKSLDRSLSAFACIFAVAAACRFISARFLSEQSESPLAFGNQRSVTVAELWRRIVAGGSERMLLYFLAVQVAVQISGPYFTPYMLKQLQISYVDFVALLATSFIAKIVALPACGRFAFRFGARRLVWVGGLGIIPVSGLWLYADSFMQLVAIQFLAGVVWAAYELAMFLLFFETVRQDERTSILTTYNLGNAIALVIGSLIGGSVLKYLGQCPEAYLFLFSLSSTARGVTLLFLRWATLEFTAPLDDDEPQLAIHASPAKFPEPATVSAPAE